jgi:hypothetical protein
MSRREFLTAMFAHKLEQNCRAMFCFDTTGAGHWIGIALNLVNTTRDCSILAREGWRRCGQPDRHAYCPD